MRSVAREIAVVLGGKLRSFNSHFLYGCILPLVSISLNTTHPHEGTTRLLDQCVKGGKAFEKQVHRREREKTTKPGIRSIHNADRDRKETETS